jgi:HAD superfamily hydrolase (TIGR01509 family)
VREAIEFVQELKESGYKTYILSNFDTQSFALLTALHPTLFNLFDGIMISGDVGLLKPEPAIYEKLLSTYNIDRTKAFFIDDQIVNVQAAKDVGIESMVCTLRKSFLSSAPDTHNARTQFYTWRNALNDPKALVA